MIQQVFGAPSSSLHADPKFPFNGPPTTLSPSPTTTNPPDNNNSSSNNNNNDNLRCPRCDSANTKFCYYNNYNLTQPRHFCKTCRRYWTKGGALMNVPIGGGCRKNKSAVLTTASKSSSGSKFLKTDDTTRLGFDHFSNPNNLWGSSQTSSSSHILALLRATSHNPNPNISDLVKEENNMVGPHMMVNSTHQLLDHDLAHVPSTSFWRSNNQNLAHHQNDSGMQELYQRLIRSSSSSSSTATATTNDYFGDHANSQPMVVMSNGVASSSSSPSVSKMMESTSELGYGWNVNPAFSWPHRAYP